MPTDPNTMTPSQQLLIEAIKVVGSIVAALLAGVSGIVLAAMAARRAGTAAKLALQNVVATTELGSRLDGKLDELKKLWQDQAYSLGHADATEQGRVAAERVADQNKEDARDTRTRSREDRAEGHDTVEGTPYVVPPTPLRRKSRAKPKPPKPAPTPEPAPPTPTDEVV